MARGKIGELPTSTARRLWVLLCLRYLLPPVSAVLLLGFGLFYNVFAVGSGRPIRLSVLRLCFNTLKSARTYLMGAEPVAAIKSFYVLVVFLTVLLLLLFLLSVALSVFVLYTLYRIRAARALRDREAEKRAKVLLRAMLPNRVIMAISNVLVLPLALFPEIFSFVSGRASVASANVFYVQCNVTAIVTATLLLATVVLAFYLRRYERALGADLYFIESEEAGADEEQAEKIEENDEY